MEVDQYSVNRFGNKTQITIRTKNGSDLSFEFSSGNITHFRDSINDILKNTNDEKSEFLKYLNNRSTTLLDLMKKSLSESDSMMYKHSYMTVVDISKKFVSDLC